MLNVVMSPMTILWSPMFSNVRTICIGGIGPIKNKKEI